MRIRFEGLMNQIFELMRQEKYFEAVQTLKAANAAEVTWTGPAEVSEAAAQLDAIGQSWVKEYQRAYEQGHYLEAIKGLGMTQRTFEPLPSSLAAAKLLEHAKYDTKALTALQEAKAQEMLASVDDIIDCDQCSYVPAPASAPATNPAADPAGRLYKIAAPAVPPVRKYIMKSRLEHIKELPPDKVARVVSILETMTRLYELAPTSVACYTDLQALKKDQSFWPTIEWHKSQQEAASMLKSADMFAANGMSAKAIEYYQKVSDKFPDTPQGKKAKEALAKLK